VPDVLFISALGLLAFALWTGHIGIYGPAVYRAEKRTLYWGQIMMLGAGTLVLGLSVGSRRSVSA
jgi:hypothetical protein